MDDDGGSRNTAYTFFQVQLTLTTEGLNAGPGFGLAAVGLFFEYMSMLKECGPQQWVWEESRKLSDMRFRCDSWTCHNVSTHLGFQSDIPLVFRYRRSCSLGRYSLSL